MPKDVAQVPIEQGVVTEQRRRRRSRPRAGVGRSRTKPARGRSRNRFGRDEPDGDVGEPIVEIATSWQACMDVVGLRRPAPAAGFAGSRSRSRTRAARSPLIPAPTTIAHVQAGRLGARAAPAVGDLTPAASCRGSHAGPAPAGGPRRLCLARRRQARSAVRGRGRCRRRNP